MLAFLVAISLWGMGNQNLQVAHAMPLENNGVGLTPALGWSSWSFIRHDPTDAKIEAQADAMKNGSTFTGYYSTDGSTWNTVGTATVPAQASTQDAGKFMVSHATSSLELVNFQGLGVQ